MFKKTFNTYITFFVLVMLIMLSLMFIMFEGKVVYIVLEVFSLSGCVFELPFLIDKYSLTFCFTVSVVSFNVFYFSKAYMSKDKNEERFVMMVIIFVLSMFLLIFSPSLISLFLGWDGLGVSSYFLVIYFQNSKSLNAGMLTALTNRLGDVFFLLSLAYFLDFTSWNYFLWSPSGVIGYSWLVWVFVLFACCTKSAQLPFSAWLPAAMAAPTPVSALVHSSTLVTAGVYTLFRFSYSFKESGLLSGLFFLGSMTMLLAGLAALMESDAKKIVALSTLSQLGIMMMTLGVGAFSGGFFHLVSHAYFKALLFIVVGNMIHLSLGYQDLRKSSASFLSSAGSFYVASLANFSLMGLPFLSGFYSKDLCIELSFMGVSNFYGELLFILGVSLTVLYSFRFSYLLMSNMNMGTCSWAVEKDSNIYFPMLVFFLGSVCASVLIMWTNFSSPADLQIGWSLKVLILLIITMSALLTMYVNLLKMTSPYIWSLYSMWSLTQTSSPLLSVWFLSVSKNNNKFSEKWGLQLQVWEFMMNSKSNNFMFYGSYNELVKNVLALMSCLIMIFLFN